MNLLPLHHPIRLAEDLAELDLLSNGRVEFGVGRGSQLDHYQGFDVPIEESRERMVESLMVIKAWTNERLNFEGKYYRAKDLPHLEMVSKRGPMRGSTLRASITGPKTCWSFPSPSRSPILPSASPPTVPIASSWWASLAMPCTPVP